MISNEITLTPEDILEKEFKFDTRGYRPQEVDKFLDIIIKDYHGFINKIKKLEIEKKELIEETLRLKHEIRNLKANLEMINNSDQVTNLDILRRLSHLEKIIYGKEED